MKNLGFLIALFSTGSLLASACGGEAQFTNPRGGLSGGSSGSSGKGGSAGAVLVGGSAGTNSTTGGASGSSATGGTAGTSTTGGTGGTGGAVGGSSGSGGSGGSDGGVGAEGGNGDGGARDGGTGGGDEPNPGKGCPATEPTMTAMARCPMRGLSCDYGDRVCQCDAGASSWNCFDQVDDCPPMRPMDGTECPMSGLVCEYTTPGPMPDATCTCDTMDEWDCQ